MRVGILTGGGDCPGLNPAIRGAILRGLDHGFEFVGLELGWKGLVEGLTTELSLERVDEIIRQGGTILWCHNAFGYEGLPQALAETANLFAAIMI